MEDVVETICSNHGRQFVAYALHVGGLNERTNPEFQDAMASADLVYADGAAVVLLGRLEGGKEIGRAPTTDLGPAVLKLLSERLGRTVRVGLLGGQIDRVTKAAAAMRETLGVETPFLVDGYRDDYGLELADAVSSKLDVLFVGLGMPREAIWVQQHLAALPCIPVLTCGGWFGFLAHEERRAPEWAQRLGLEWLFRLAQSPRRLLGRYARGLTSVVMLALPILFARVSKRRIP
jgi:N-acetylglucosaminyldiphosphoundecaprenol N-acetyl-beta-D-mannosaminyltransferase